MPVIDASVYIALLKANEAEHQSSWNWFRNACAAQQKILTPVILLAEVAAGIRCGVGDSQLADQATKQLESAGLIELVPVSLNLARRAAEIAAQHGPRGCDAIYVALAEQMGEPLITLDRQQLERTPAPVIAQRPSEN
jgi:predicted nucleic acid-binding protein